MRVHRDAVNAVVWGLDEQAHGRREGVVLLDGDLETVPCPLWVQGMIWEGEVCVQKLDVVGGDDLDAREAEA